MTASRGAFILFEGVDRCGKSTQAALLSNHYLKDRSVELIRFPNRQSNIGQVIDAYLQVCYFASMQALYNAHVVEFFQSKTELSDNAIHLLFSANRWEASADIERKLAAGTTLVCDRYAYSGVAFSSAKGLNFEWCRTCDKGLPAPDCIIFLDIDVHDASKVEKICSL